MMKNPKNIYSYFKRTFDPRIKYISYEDALYSVIKAEFFNNKNHPDINEHINKSFNVYLKHLNEDIKKHNANSNSYLKYEWKSNGQYILSGNAYITSSDDKNTKADKRRLINTYFFEKILSKSKPDLFEKLCKKILSHIGCQIAKVTRYSGDAGIDFFGTMVLNDIGHGFLFNKLNIFPNMKVHFLGQAKRYSVFNIIQPAAIREFLGSILLLEYTQAWNLQSELSIKNLPQQYLLAKDPIICIFITNGFASENAKKVANKLGIHLQDGEALAKWLSYSIFPNFNSNESDLLYQLNKWINS